MPAGPGLSERAAAITIRSRASEGAEPVPGRVYSPPARHRADAGPGADQRFRGQTGGDVVRLFLAIDADDTLWENNIYFEAAFEEFVAFRSEEHTSELQ